MDLPVQVVRVTGCDADGVTLSASPDPDFDRLVESLLPGHAEKVLCLKPYLAVVSNRSPKTVVAYTVAWTITLRNGTTEVRHAQYKFPDAVIGACGALPRGREIRQAEQRLLGIGFELWPPEDVESYRDYGVAKMVELSGAKELTLELDAVIFEDGTLVGPDTSGLAEHFAAYVQAKQVLYRAVIADLETSHVSEDVLGPLRESVARPHRPDPSRPLALYARQAAAEVLAWHNRLVRDAFRQAVLARPFFTFRRN